MPNSAILRRAASLLALSIDQAGLPEGELARAKAERLMKKYDFDRAMVEDFSEENEGRAIEISEEPWQRKLFIVTTWSRGCCLFTLSGTSCLLFGRPSDMDMVQLLFEEMLRRLDKAMRETEGISRWTESEFSDWRSSFILGSIERLKSVTLEGDEFSSVRAERWEAAKAKIYNRHEDARSNPVVDIDPTVFEETAFERGLSVVARHSLGIPKLKGADHDDENGQEGIQLQRSEGSR